MVFFEKEFRGTKTIAELYAESGDIKKDFGNVDLQRVKENLQRLKTPVWTAFVVLGKGEKDEYRVKMLDKEEVFLVQDKSTFPRVNVGDWFGGKLYPFGDRCYISGYLISIPKSRIYIWRKTRSLSESLEKEFGEFMKTKSDFSERTVRKYEKMFPLLLDYVKEKEYTIWGQIRRLNVDTWIKWIRRSFLYVSRSEEDDHRATIRQFLGYLQAKDLA